MTIFGNMAFSYDDNVDFVKDWGLCIGCGTCFGVCPFDAVEIKMEEKWGEYQAYINHDKCKNCRICVKSCPGLGFDFDEFNIKTHQRIPKNPWIGNYKKIFIAHAKDPYIRYFSSSGGISTLILTHLIETGAINGAVVTKISEHNPFETVSYIATNKDEILKSMGSIYEPTHPGTVIKNLLHSNGIYAFVGLPCHLQGVVKAMESVPILRKKIFLTIGLMCSNNTTIHGVRYFLDKIFPNLEPNKIRKLYFRKGGWLPKKEIVVKVGDNEYKEDYGLFNRIVDRQAFHRHFVQRRCLVCIDHTAETADISLGDPRWKKLGLFNNPGESLVVIRTDVGVKVWENLVDTGKIDIVKEIDDENFFYEIQDPVFKKGASSRMMMLKLLRRPIPFYKASHKKDAFFKFSFRYFTKYVLSYLNNNFLKKNLITFFVIKEYYRINLLDKLFKLKKRIFQWKKRIIHHN